MPSFYHLLIVLLSLCSLISFWIHKNFWLWGPPLTLSLLCAYATGVITPIGFIPIVILALTLLALRFNPTGLCRFILVSIVLVATGALFYHLLPGIAPSFLFLGTAINYGKYIAGLLILGFLIPLLDSKAAWISFAKMSLLLSLLGSIAILCVCLYLKPSLVFSQGLLGLLSSSILSCVIRILPEEALLRGFIQREFFLWIGNNLKGHVCSILLSSCLYPLFHMIWMEDLSLLAILFVANIVYGSLYQITRQFEATLFCHFLTHLALGSII